MNSFDNAGVALTSAHLAGFTPDAEQQAALKQAFHNFAVASSKLQEKYETLCVEAEQLKKRLQEKEEEIARSAKLSMLGETAAALAHEVRNPLGALKLFVSLLREDCATMPHALNLLQEMGKSINALDGVVSNVLQFARTQKQDFSPLNVHSLIREQISQLLPQSSVRLSISLDLGGNPFVLGNEHSFRQVFLNVLLNALQSMHYVGSLRISSMDIENQLQVEVIDSGPGVNSKLIEKIFDPFVTDRKGGTGLGLAVVKNIMEQHGGTVAIENVLEKNGASSAVVGARVILRFERSCFKQG